MAIARTLIHDPDIILFDEPTTGLDITSSNIFREFIHQLKQQNKTILFSSHIMEEVSLLCDSVMMIHQGELVYKGTLPELYAQEQSEDLNYIFMSKLARGMHNVENRLLKEMTDSLRDRKTLLLTVLIPLLTMLGLVFSTKA